MVFGSGHDKLTRMRSPTIKIYPTRYSLQSMSSQAQERVGEEEHVPLSCSSKAASSTSLAIREVGGRKARIDEILGGKGWRFYVYVDGPFWALTTDLELPKPVPKSIGNEGTGCVWTHRALSAHPQRTMDPLDADLYIVPAYLVISYETRGRDVHDAEVDAMLSALVESEHFKRNGGSDHLFIGLSDVNSPNARKRGFMKVAELMKEGYTGAFEVNSGWLGGFSRDHTVAVPYVANEFVINDGDLNDFSRGETVEEAMRHRDLTVAITSDPRKHAWEWGKMRNEGRLERQQQQYIV